ncbi:spore coat polysaccharide biosynthesis predicted glycosyltransferase SpsG [Lutibacter sp. Hel_I_33_5]|uniref:cytidine 5'-phosphate N-acetylneuraminic acid synthetase n=1 Tax=Lutibacter sp. Hel_I_33_5 TaxID=1566289 RepID=UPI0011A8EFCE|nr:cytidine 5'-phosphate N-acetylneuraminic acid synthetase [Lutibacter sp. Hel_I_33_5]TVZ55508.1 spore coat polysaccharide biosynthesis predicted glycosyltransferase SpsG [Lutibacter sp. Hel_I_33_5]
MKDICIIIPAFKKNAIIPDQLVKNLAGETLIQRAISLSKEILDGKDIYIITDSQEISLIAERNNVNFKYDSKLNVNPTEILKNLEYIFDFYSKKYKSFFLYRANAPLLNAKIINDAISYFKKNSEMTIVSVKKEERRLFKADKGDLNMLFIDGKNSFFEEVNAFQISKFVLLKNKQAKMLPYILPSDIAIEINGYQSWWICEKLLNRKKIVFNVIGSLTVGMGHIYRSLSLAHDITNHEIVFVCDDTHQMVVDKIALKDYKVLSCQKAKITDFIIGLEPDLVINDTLNTTKSDILKLKTKGIKIVNFEDLGSGSKHSDYTINELYDLPIMKGTNYLWGHDYFFLRDEFKEAKPHDIIDPVKSVLISFGGTDQNNLSKIILDLILPVCEEKDIKIFIVCGAGYIYKEELLQQVSNQQYRNIELVFESGAISKIMEKTQIAISSNGRTVYELADMNIPSIIISQHERETTHKFACLENGFINMGIFKNDITNNEIIYNFKKLINDESFRILLFQNIKKYNFRFNKSKVLNTILSLIEK